VSVGLDAAGDTANIAIVTINNVDNVVVTDGNNVQKLATPDSMVTSITVTGNNSANQNVDFNTDFIFAGLSGLSVDQVTGTSIKRNVTTANDQTYNEAVSLGSNATLASTSGTLTFAGAVTAGANNLILQADTIALNGGANSVSGTGKIELAPAAAGDG